LVVKIFGGNNMAGKLTTPFENCYPEPGSGDNGNMDSPVSASSGKLSTPFEHGTPIDSAGVQPESLKLKFMEKLPVSTRALETPFVKGLGIAGKK
jgi:hypothetical protein